MIQIAAALHRTATHAGIASGRYRRQATKIGGLIPYATCTQSSTNLTALRGAGWRILLSPDQPRPPDWAGFCIDNGAWGLFQKGRVWDSSHEKRWIPILERHGKNADFAVLPDIVAGGAASLELSLSWVPRLRGLTCLLIAVQDGMQISDIEPYLSADIGIFVGGSTEWKLSTVRGWIELCARKGAWCHVGRVNSIRRVNLIAGATSFDGTSCSIYSCTLPRMEGARRQTGLGF